jgi:hypothetical protein
VFNKFFGLLDVLFLLSSCQLRKCLGITTEEKYKGNKNGVRFHISIEGCSNFEGSPDDEDINKC